MGPGVAWFRDGAEGVGAEVIVLRDCKLGAAGVCAGVTLRCGAPALDFEGSGLDGPTWKMRP